MTMSQGAHIGQGAGQEPFRELRIIVAGAGTGGHLFPGLAVVDRLFEMAANLRPCFVTTGRPIENTVLGERNFETVRISAAGMKGKTVWGKLQSLGFLIKGLLDARRILKMFKPHMVLGMGGYSAAPVVISAWAMGIPRVIHEQNRVPGITNRFLGRFSDRVFVSFADTVIPGAKGRLRYTGYPVRPEIKARPGPDNGAEHRRSGVEGKTPMTILVLGGSQGARSINKAVTGALDYLDNAADFEFVHQTGAADEGWVSERYENKGVKAVVSAFFTDMASLYQGADLAICRAGAGTIAELAASGVPSILVPYPYAADDHQTANATGMAVSGGAQVLFEADMTPAEMARRMRHFRFHPEALEQMRKNIEQHAGTDAAAMIAGEILALAGFAPAGQQEAFE